MNSPVEQHRLTTSRRTSGDTPHLVTAEDPIDRFLVVVCHGASVQPLSAVVIGRHQAAWLSANRCVAVWTWPGRPKAPEGRLRRQVGGHGPGKGHFVAIDIDALGRGSIQQDEFGLAPLYTANHDGFSFVANRPGLIADAWHRIVGRLPERDALFGALLAFKGYPMGDRTGYRDIRCVPFGSTLRVSPEGVQVDDRDYTPPWLAGHDGASVEAAIDEVEALFIAAFRQAVADEPAFAGRPALQLTGGRDSRLAIALALRSGVLDGLDVITHGDPQAEDARIAREVARAAGARHTQHEWLAGSRDFLAHVRSSCGALNLWEAVTPPDLFGRSLIVSGLLGETLRTNFPSTSPLDKRALVLGAFYNPPSLDLLTETAWSDVFVETMRLLLAPLNQGAATEDLHDAFYVQHRIRRWISARPDAFTCTYFPLYCPRAVHLAFALGWQVRVRNVIHDSIIARAGHGLGKIPYAGPKEARRPRRAGFRYPESGTPILDPPELRRVAQSWRPRRPRRRLSETPDQPANRETVKRMRAYRDIIHAAPDNPAFEVIDRERLLMAVRNLPSLPLHLAKQVHGAMATVIWLGELEQGTTGVASLDTRVAAVD